VGLRLRLLAFKNHNMFNYNPWMYYSHTNGEGELDLVLKSYDKDWTKC
jgi:hypothetical protein